MCNFTDHWFSISTFSGSFQIFRNDFLPHLNTLDISEGAFDLLFQIYKDQRPSWGEGQYLTESGNISDALRLENYLAAIGNVETETLENREVLDAEYIKKKRRWNKRDGLDGGPSDKELKAAEDAKLEVLWDDLLYQPVWMPAGKPSLNVCLAPAVAGTVDQCGGLQAWIKLFAP